MLTIVFALCCAFGFAACNKEATPPDTEKPKHTGELKEGYVKRYDDGFTGTVHWVMNEDTGFEIYTRIFRPENFDESKKYPLLIVSHGYNDVSKEGYSILVSNTVAQGMICVTFDFCGGGKLSKSEGKTTDMSVLTEISDLETVLAEMQGMSYIDTSKIALFGQSFGGMVSSVTAARHNDEIAALILQAPAIGMANKGGYTSKDEIPETTLLNYMTVGKKYFIDAWDFDSWNEIGNYKKDVLILYGTEDDAIKPETIDRARGVYGEDRCTVKIVEGAPHGFGNPHYQVILEDINGFFVQTGLISAAS
ncbi:MAG: alpha/beta fold hydrolase [Roseburia sp.]|nr:alpha/beta fold hydrolase [Roseburia sp.]